MKNIFIRFRKLLDKKYIRENLILNSNAIWGK